MKLVKPSHAHIKLLMSWFNNEKELVSWGGPQFHYPFTAQSFQDDLRLTELSSYVLLSKATPYHQEQLLAFGQFYSRLNKCHLGRLVVNPKNRGQGVATQLVTQLINIGQAELATSSSSLFVYPDNHSAVRSYQKLGFEFAEYPEEMNMNGCLYMIKEG